VPPARAAAASPWAASRRVAAAPRRRKLGYSGYVIPNADYWKPVSSDGNNSASGSSDATPVCAARRLLRSQGERAAGSQVVRTGRADTYGVT